MVFTMLALLMGAFPALAFEMYIYLENNEHVDVSTARGKLLPLSTGANYITLEDSDSPLTLTPREGCAFTELVYDGHFAWPGEEAVTIDVGEGSSISVYTRGEIETYNVSFTGDLDSFTSVAGSVTLDPHATTAIKQNEAVGISPRPGYIITSVTTTPFMEVMGGGNQWVFFLTSDVTVNVTAKEAPKGNVVINIDDPTNAAVTTAIGKVLSLEAGDNYVAVDPETESPLKVSARPGANILIVADPTIIQPDADGTYTVNINPDAALTNLYIVTERYVSNNLTINVNDATFLDLKDDSGNSILLSDGTNRLAFDFTGNDMLHASATGDGTLSRVVVDNIDQEITDGKCDFRIYKNSVVDILMSGSTQETGWISIVNEDFSGFPEGTEDEPDLFTSLLLENGYFIDPSRFRPYNPDATNAWGGMNLYPAGGSLAVIGGFLNTPTGDYSGNLRMTFRARLIPGHNPENVTGIEVLLIRRSAIVDYKRQTFTLTPEWQTFTFEADNGWFHDTCIQFFSAGEVSYQLDDIKIEHRIVGIEPPKSGQATDLGDDGFTANWETTDTADKYLLSVFTKEGDGEVENIVEDFESLTVDGNGHISTFPTGWEYNLSASGSDRELNEDSAFSASGLSVCLDGTGDYIQSPVNSRGISRLSFHLGADNSLNGNAMTSAVLNVGALTDSGWMPWLMQSMTYLVGAGGTADVDVTDHLNLYDNIYAVRFELQKSSEDRVLVMIDNVDYCVPGPELLNYVWEDREVEGGNTSSCRVEDEAMDPDTDYWYHVKAANTSYVSEPSEAVMAFYAQTPVAFDATDVSENSFTANWECGPKADSFDLMLYRTFEAREDIHNAVIIEEDFGHIQSSGTPENPETGAYTTGTFSLDEYTRLPGWTATSYSFANGAVGGLPAKDGYQVGGLITPSIDLSNNGGKCRLILRAWFEDGDAIQIQGNSSATYIASAWNGTGWKDLECELQNCGDREKLTIWSGFGRPFMIDYIRIEQDLKAGDRVDIVTNAININDVSLRSMHFDRQIKFDDLKLGYEVAARRYYNGDPSDFYLSYPSERINVELLGSSIEPAIEDQGLRITAGERCATIELSSPARVEAYSTDGLQLRAMGCEVGTTTIPLPSGLCILRVDNRTYKLQIR